MNVQSPTEKYLSLKRKIEEYQKRIEGDYEAIKALEYSKIVLDKEIEKRMDQIQKNDHVIKQAERDM
ncbi:MAG: hypothetical protein Q4P17_04045 [Methanobacterium sp.]|nr:hypothetical protein [Methanobacterium sp.]